MIIEKGNTSWLIARNTDGTVTWVVTAGPGAGKVIARGTAKGQMAARRDVTFAITEHVNHLEHLGGGVSAARR